MLTQTQLRMGRALLRIISRALFSNQCFSVIRQTCCFLLLEAGTEFCLHLLLIAAKCESYLLIFHKTREVCFLKKKKKRKLSIHLIIMRLNWTTLEHKQLWCKIFWNILLENNYSLKIYAFVSLFWTHIKGTQFQEQREIIFWRSDCFLRIWN